MAVKDFYELKDKNDSLVLAAINVAVLLAPYGTEIPTTLTDETGKLKELPKGWFSVGEIEKKAGVDLAPEFKVDGPEGYGSPGRRRDFVTDQAFNIDFVAQEARLSTLDMYYDLDVENAVRSNGSFFAKARQNTRLREYSAILLGYDGAPGEEVYPYWVYPKVTKEKAGKQSLGETDALTFPMTLSAKLDPKYKALFGFGLAGPGVTGDLAKAFEVTPIGSQAATATGAFNLSGATGGTFTVSVGSRKTSDLAFNASASAVQSALRAAGESGATVTGDATSGFTISNVSAKPTVDGSKLTGGTFPKSVTVS